MPEGSRLVKPHGEEIRRLRKMKGWSVEELAGNAGVTEATVMSVEKGKGCFPGTLARIAKALKVEVAAVVSDETRGIEVTSPASQAAGSKGFIFRIKTKTPYRAADETVDPVLIMRLLYTVLPDAEIEYLGTAPSSTIYSFSISGAEPAKLVEAFRQDWMLSISATAVQVRMDGREDLPWFDVIERGPADWLSRHGRIPAHPAQFESDHLFNEVLEREMWALGTFARGLTVSERLEWRQRMGVEGRGAEYYHFAAANGLFQRIRNWLGGASIPHTADAAREITSIVGEFCREQHFAITHPETQETCTLVAAESIEGGELYLETADGERSYGTTCISTMIPFRLTPLAGAIGAELETASKAISSPL